VHPLLQGRLRPLLYSLIWVGIGGAMTALFLLVKPRPIAHALLFAGPLSLVYGSVCLSAWYVCRTNSIGEAAPWRIVVSGFGAAVQASAVWVGLGALWGVILSRAGVGNRDNILADVIVLGIAGVVLYAESLAAHYFLQVFDAVGQAQRRVLASQVEAREAELRALRAQINPHFLFNSLNSISALTGSDPEAARRMCQLLGDFLRTSLTLGGREHITLAEEIGLADRYLSIEQVRFGDRLRVQREVDPGALRCQVPPLLIQPLIENAVKHGVADRVEGGTIRITAHRRDTLLEVVIENPRDPEAPPRRGAGVGLDNVRKRLETLDPQRSRVEVTKEPERFEVVITLTAVDDAPAAPNVVAMPPPTSDREVRRA
jgi:Histidine kinase